MELTNPLRKLLFPNFYLSQELVAHAYNPVSSEAEIRRISV
jgi:hypothetical protein